MLIISNHCSKLKFFWSDLATQNISQLFTRDTWLSNDANICSFWSNPHSSPMKFCDHLSPLPPKWPQGSVEVTEIKAPLGGWKWTLLWHQRTCILKLKCLVTNYIWLHLRNVLSSGVGDLVISLYEFLSLTIAWLVRRHLPLHSESGPGLEESSCLRPPWVLVEEPA